MRKLMALTVCMAAFTVPAAALAQDDDDRRRGRGASERFERGDDDDRRGRREARADRGDRDDDRFQHSRDRGRDREDDDDDRRRARDPRDDRRDVRRAVRDRVPVIVLGERGRRGVIQGCPPGLAKKDNGCLPPGQARQVARVERDRYDWYWSRNRDDGRYRYDQGYVYRVDDGGGVLGWLPVLGGALGLGSVWPQQYQWQPTPRYQADYWNLGGGDDYRYADGVVYGVDPQTQAINGVVALLTGQQWNVGQPMPAGYDVYNVPYRYRGQYADSADALYRYDDGYVYQVDPTTRLVQAVIQLLA